jgi:hypothetical protein
VLLKAWRWAAKRVGQTTAEEMVARLEYQEGRRQRKSAAAAAQRAKTARVAEPEELRHVVRNPAAAAAALGTTELELAPASKKTGV